jgi:hypothetical protein
MFNAASAILLDLATGPFVRYSVPIREAGVTVQIGTQLGYLWFPTAFLDFDTGRYGMQPHDSETVTQRAFLDG